ncbi:MAG: hypothetical protein L6V88_03575 [Anaerotruncus sp.]|nr:MAG: hypothetical protein L6V88_03575 [Anaerotruncus sp.]
MKKFFDLNKKGFAAYMPLFALCAAAVLHYVLLLAGFKYADAFFLSCSLCPCRFYPF